MKEAIVSVDKDQTITVKVVDSPVPKPGPTQVLIKVAVSGTNPKDWKVPIWLPEHNNSNSGDDIAGVVHSVGSAVTEFKAGDRVASFHKMRTPAGSFAEYALGEEHSTFSLPSTTSFEEGATIPLAAMTAAIGLFCRIGVPEPWNKNDEDRAKVRGGVVVYGAASAVGAFAIQLLQKTDVHPIIAVAGRGEKFVESLIDRSKGDTIVDYRKGEAAVVDGMRKGIKPGEKLRHAFDAVSDHGSYLHISQVIEPDGYITTVLPGKKYEGVPPQIHLNQTNVGTSHSDDKDFATAWFRLLAYGLKDGWFKPHPHELLPGGLAGVQQGLEGLRNGKASAVKYVYRISETEGAGKD